MFTIVCGALFASAIVLNVQDRRMLALTLAVGASFFLPVPKESALHFYIFCIAAECLVFLVALMLKARATGMVQLICLLMTISHVMALSLGGYGFLNPYQFIVKILEFSQLAACVALSPVLLPILRNHDVPTQ